MDPSKAAKNIKDAVETTAEKVAEKAADIIIGSATCGIPVPDISIFSGPAIPMALAGAAVVGITFFVHRRRQAA